MSKLLLRLTLCFYATFSVAASLPDAVDKALQENFPHASVGIVVKNANTGALLYQRNAHKRLMPGSGVKLFTAAASFYHFQPDTVFSTQLLAKGKNVYLKFVGAPDFQRAQLDALLAHLKAEKKIAGNLVIDTSRFVPPYYPAGITYDDLGWYYAAPDTAAIMDENEAAFEVRTAKKLGGPVSIKALSKDSGIVIINQLKTVAPAEYRKHCSMHIQRLADNQLKLYGCLAKRNSPRFLKFSVSDPLLRAKQQIQASLKRQGIRLAGKIEEGKAPAHARLIASSPSEPISVLLKHMLHESDNLYANSMTKQLAYDLTEEGSYKQGVFAIKQILSEKAALNMDAVKLADGLGTRYSLMSPQQMVDLLTVIYQSQSLRKQFFNALPQAAVSGTLADRMKNTPLAQRVYAKTGTLHDVSSLSGFWLRESKPPLIFSIIFNDVSVPIGRAKAMEEKLLLMMQDL